MDPVAQRDALAPIPTDEDCPKAGPAGVLPNVEVPNAGAPVVVDQGDGLDPSADEPPNAGVAGDPNAGGLLAGEPNAVETERAGVGVATAEATASPAPIPGYVVPPRIDSL